MLPVVAALLLGIASCEPGGSDGTTTGDGTGDGTIPALSGAALDSSGLRLTITFSETLAPAQVPVAAFAVSGASTTVQAAAVSGAEVTLTLASAVPCGVAVKLSYTPGDPALADEAGNRVAAFSDLAVANGSTVPRFSGFDFALEPGDFWCYDWDYEKIEWGSTTGSASGSFRVSLGSAAVTIGGVSAYPVTITGTTPEYGTPRWSHLAVSDNRLLGSTDGASLKEIFNAKRGVWTGGGFFTEFADSSVCIAAAGSVNTTQYVDSDVVAVGSGFNTDNAYYVEGYGYFTTGDPDMSGNNNEYYKQGLGPVAYHYEFRYQDDSTNIFKRSDVGLSCSSLQSAWTIPPDFSAVYYHYNSGNKSETEITIGPGILSHCHDYTILITTDEDFQVEVSDMVTLYNQAVGLNAFRGDSAWHNGSATQSYGYVKLTKGGVTYTIYSYIDSSYTEECAVYTGLRDTIQALNSKYNP